MVLTYLHKLDPEIHIELQKKKKNTPKVEMSDPQASKIGKHGQSHQGSYSPVIAIDGPI